LSARSAGVTLLGVKRGWHRGRGGGRNVFSRMGTVILKRIYDLKQEVRKDSVYKKRFGRKRVWHSAKVIAVKFDRYANQGNN